MKINKKLNEAEQKPLKTVEMHKLYNIEGT